MKICVIIPMYGKEEYTRRCIEFVCKNAGFDHDILIVDDGSKVPFNIDRYKSDLFNLLRLEKNSGFTAACNAGIIWAQKFEYDYVLLLNNDTEPERDFLKHLVDTIESDKTIGIAASVRRHKDRKFECMELCGSDLIRGYQYFADESKLPSSPIECNWIPLCSALIRMDMIREIGLLDKRMINHCSDTDYCFRAKINHWKVMLVPKSIVLHHLSVTVSSNNIVVDTDQKIMLEKLAGLDYQKLMASMPLDGESKTWGRLTFEVYRKD